MNITPVILAGGAGTRLWPLSRDEKPKQFHNLSGRGTLLEETIRRLLPLDPGRVLIVTSKKHESLSREELGKFKMPGIVLAEPRPRNTAAAILYAAIYLEKLGDDSVMMALPADHHILDTAGFDRTLREGITQAEKGVLVTIGITPTYPETGYGYIKAAQGTGKARQIDSFVEKPDISLARTYFESGNYFWNSGIFIWKTSAIMGRFRELMPEHMKAFEALSSLSGDEIASNEGEVWEIKKRVFDGLESISIDYGIMEKADNRIVIPGDFGWTDLGSWKSIDEILAPDGNRNRSPKRERAIFLQSENCSVYTETNRVSVVGLSDVIVVEADGEILVIRKDAAQEVKKIAEMAKK
ncbi:MAG: mannose-1-phosphate guanylyltransferase [Chrysiogenales bacterium]|nr:MAG: mannose-1-phosphate guanylyltransferase [Chrysiogenales bacterium]